MMPKSQHPLVSIVTPAYNEAKNLPIFYDRLVQVLGPLDLHWEWVVVDDHSADETFRVITQLAGKDGRIRGFRFSRNSGSHMAMTCGLHEAAGDCSVVMSADLQDPPETVLALLAEWRAGAQVVWAVRGQWKGEKANARGFSRLYYLLMRNVVGMREMPAAGADFFAIDRRVASAFREFRETNISLFALITWMGFRQATVTYDKEERLHGQSGWSLEKKLKMVVDSVTSFTYLPIRMMSYVGFVTALAGFLYAAVTVFRALQNKPPEGWASLMVVVLVVSGVQMLMMGVLGEYLWRALDEARGRPRYLIEQTTAEPRAFEST